MDLLTGINQDETAILLVTHDARVAARADRVLFMKDGEIVSEQRFDRYTGRDMESRVEKLIVQMSRIEI
jgi:putative ABC transport system ATP-binding protein